MRVIEVACLCAGWCRTCDTYAAEFDAVIRSLSEALRPRGVELRPHWIDIEDEADLIGDYDVETFPTLLVSEGGVVRVLAPLRPDAGTLQRVLESAATGDEVVRDEAVTTLEALIAALPGRPARWPAPG